MRSKHPPGAWLGKTFGPLVALVAAMLIACGISPVQAGTLGTPISPPAANGLVLENTGITAATFDQKEARTAQLGVTQATIASATDTVQAPTSLNDIRANDPASFAPTLQPNNGTTSPNDITTNLTLTATSAPPTIFADSNTGNIGVTDHSGFRTSSVRT